MDFRVLVMAFGLFCFTPHQVLWATETDSLCRLRLENPTLAEAIPTATYESREYWFTHDRSLKEYNFATGVRQSEAQSLIRLIPPGGLVIDSGGGQGAALGEILKKRPDARGVLINTQDFSSERGLLPLPNNLLFEQDFAQNALPRYRNQAHLILDVWGAFTYSPNKVEVLQLMYDALVPGGKAFLVYEPDRTPAEVKVGWFKKVELGHWLSQHFPQIFHSKNSPSRHGYVLVLEISKPLENSEFHLPLRMKSHRLIRRMGLRTHRAGVRPILLPEALFEPVSF